MDDPDKRLFDADLASASYCIRQEKGHWGLVGADALPAATPWPSVFFWIKAPPRPAAPDRYYFALDVRGYRNVSPTGTFWDPVNKTRLDFSKYPKGTPNSRFARVFRTDWGESARALYHPYDRVASGSHQQWPTEQAHLVWTSANTIVDYLNEFYTLLNGGDYLGA